MIEVKSSETGWFPKLKIPAERFLETRAKSAAAGKGFWKPESTPEGIQEAGEEIRDNIIDGVTVVGVKMEVSLPKQNAAGTPNIAFKQW